MTRVKKIMDNGKFSARHMEGTIDESERGKCLSTDAILLKCESERRGLPER